MNQQIDRPIRWLTLLVNVGVALGLIIVIVEVRQNTALTRSLLEADTSSQRTASEASLLTPSSAQAPTPSGLALQGATRAGTRALDCVGAGRDAAADDIARQRAVFNHAIETADIDGLADVFAGNVVLITGSDSDVFLGRDDQLALWREDFGNPRRLIYRRTSDCIRLSPAAPIAVEYGSWRGTPADGDEPLAAGSYTAKWRREAGGWRLEAEVFTTDHCVGDYCPSP